MKKINILFSILLMNVLSATIVGDDILEDSSAIVSDFSQGLGDAVSGNFLQNERYAEPDCCSSSLNCDAICDGWEAEIRGAGVYSSSKRYRKIYSDWSPEVQFEIAKSLWSEWNIYGWVNVAYLWKHGRSTPLHNKTHVSLVPVTFGLKYMFPISCDLKGYFGVGAAYTFLRVRDHSDFVKKHISRQGWGGVLKSGLQYNLSESFFIDVFADYLFQYFNRPHVSNPYVRTNGANLGGLRVGGGIGMRF